MEKGMAAGARLLCVARKFSDSEVEFPPVSHTNALLITPAFQILNRNNVQWFQSVHTIAIKPQNISAEGERCSLKCCYASHIFWNVLKYYLWVRAVACAEEALRCENEWGCEGEERKKQNKPEQCAARSVQNNMFSHETYGHTSCRSYIVAVISGFILSSHPFVPPLYWTAPLLALRPSSLFCHLSLLLPRKIPHLIWCSYKSLNSQRRGLTVDQSQIYIQRCLWVIRVTTVSKKDFVFSDFQQMFMFETLKPPLSSNPTL